MYREHDPIRGRGWYTLRGPKMQRHLNHARSSSLCTLVRSLSSTGDKSALQNHNREGVYFLKPKGLSLSDYQYWSTTRIENSRSDDTLNPFDTGSKCQLDDQQYLNQTNGNTPQGMRST